MRKLFRISLFILQSSLFILCVSCSDDEEAPFPSLVTELADCPTDVSGNLTEIVLDDDTRLPLTNPQSGLKASVVYRCLTGYTLSDGKATLYQLKSAYILRDSTSVAVTDPTGVISLWRTKRYLNLHLAPKTQGGTQMWGYAVDSIVGRRAYLRLHHRQGTDPAAYSSDEYASLYLKDLAADSITLRIQTFNGWREWEL